MCRTHVDIDLQPDVPFHRIASGRASANKRAASTIVWVENCEVFFLSMPTIVTRIRVNKHIMLAFAARKIALVMGSTAVLEDGTMKPTFLQEARSGRDDIARGAHNVLFEFEL